MNSIKVKKINFILFGTFEYFWNIHPNLFLVSCAGEIFWDTCFHSYSPNIILRKDKFSQQHFKKISQTLWKSRTLLILNSYTDILPKISVTFWVISDNFWKFWEQISLAVPLDDCFWNLYMQNIKIQAVKIVIG